MSKADRTVKQVLVWRNDLRNTEGNKVRTGKIVAQLAHASMAAITTGAKMESGKMTISMTQSMEKWLTGIFTKVAVVATDEDELLNIYHKAKAANIPCSLILDSGLTEFGGKKTYTAVAVGPATNEVVDAITGNLKLL